MLTMESWRARLGALKSRGVPDGDPRVVECQRGLAFHRVRRAAEGLAGELSPAELAEAVGA